MSSETSETRTKILAACWALLVNNGDAAVRMSDIAKRAGVSRQAIYLHFKTRTDVLVATTRYIDEVKEVDKRLAPSRTAQSGPARLDAYVKAWGNYIPEIYPVALALLAVIDEDEAAKVAWHNRMQAMREGCEAAVTAIQSDGLLSSKLSVAKATDLLWTQLSVRNWEQLTKACGWSQKEYLRYMKVQARSVLIDSRNAEAR